MRQHQTCTLPVFGLLHDIILVGSENPKPRVLFIIKTADTLGFYHRIFGYVVSLCETEEFACIPIGSLKFYHPFNAFQTSEGLVVKSKHDLPIVDTLSIMLSIFHFYRTHLSLIVFNCLRIHFQFSI